MSHLCGSLNANPQWGSLPPPGIVDTRAGCSYRGNRTRPGPQQGRLVCQLVFASNTFSAGATSLCKAEFASGEETVAISLDREVFEGGIAHEDGAITLQLGSVEFVIARRQSL